MGTRDEWEGLWNHALPPVKAPNVGIVEEPKAAMLQEIPHGCLGRSLHCLCHQRQHRPPAHITSVKWEKSSDKAVIMKSKVQGSVSKAL